MNSCRKNKGFTLIELMIGLSIAAVFTTAIVQLVIAASSSYQLQQSLGALQENARFAINTMQSEIESAGYQQQPWISSADWAIDSIDDVSATSDSVIIRRWSDSNCFENPNPTLDIDAKPAFYLRETRFSVSGSGNLAQTCRYGPGSTQLTTQINNLGLVENVEAFQMLYAEDSDLDGNADRWVTAGKWSDEKNVLAIRLAILLTTTNPVDAGASTNYQVLDQSIPGPDDGRIRRVFESTFSIRGRHRGV
ncbi:MAG: prepilin-type N-terminal cleavage/methylation domain-containing protein [Lysobacterales bacterium]|jgi:prepilin-type N-terminal cleavage/methylation domain-containing protein